MARKYVRKHMRQQPPKPQAPKPDTFTGAQTFTADAAGEPVETVGLAPADAYAAPPRPEMRAPMRDESPRERAARRTAELQDNLSDVEGMDDKYAVENVPEGWEYQWRTATVLGASNPSYDVALARAGWEAVPVDRHPEMMPKGWKGSIIERDGMILMERPKEINDERKRRELQIARLQVRQKEAELYGTPAGQLDRTGVKIGKSAPEPVVIPE